MDLLLVPGFVSHLEALLDHPLAEGYFERLVSFSRLIMFDKRGQGLSDRPPQPPTLEQAMEDARGASRSRTWSRWRRTRSSSPPVTSARAWRARPSSSKWGAVLYTFRRGKILRVDGFLFSDKEKVSEAVRSIVEGASTPEQTRARPTDSPT